jgi:hypothetical protein
MLAGIQKPEQGKQQRQQTGDTQQQQQQQLEKGVAATAQQQQERAAGAEQQPTGDVQQQQGSMAGTPSMQLSPAGMPASTDAVPAEQLGAKVNSNSCSSLASGSSLGQPATQQTSMDPRMRALLEQLQSAPGGECLCIASCRVL